MPVNRPRPLRATTATSACRSGCSAGRPRGRATLAATARVPERPAPPVTQRPGHRCRRWPPRSSVELVGAAVPAARADGRVVVPRLAEPDLGQDRRPPRRSADPMPPVGRGRDEDRQLATRATTASTVPVRGCAVGAFAVVDVDAFGRRWRPCRGAGPPVPRRSLVVADVPVGRLRPPPLCRRGLRAASRSTAASASRSWAAAWIASLTRLGLRRRRAGRAPPPPSTRSGSFARRSAVVAVDRLAGARRLTRHEITAPRQRHRLVGAERAQGQLGLATVDVRRHRQFPHVGTGLRRAPR